MLFSPHGSALFSTSANTSPCPSSATDHTPSLLISTGLPFTSTGAPLESSSTILLLPESATQRLPEESTATPVGSLSAPAPEPVNVFSSVPLGLYSSTSFSAGFGTYTSPAESAAICTSVKRPQKLRDAGTSNDDSRRARVGVVDEDLRGRGRR